jgi:citrate lyase subunit beta/citryl-CoA lyase
MEDRGAMLKTARSWLFVPALRASELVPKAAASGADVVVIDLEDATALDQKDAAREIVRGLALPRPSVRRRRGAAEFRRP